MDALLVLACACIFVLRTVSDAASTEQIASNPTIEYGGWKPLRTTATPTVVTISSRGRSSGGVFNASREAQETRRNFYIAYPPKEAILSRKKIVPLLSPAASEPLPLPEPQSVGFRPKQRYRQLSPPLRGYPTQLRYHRLRYYGPGTSNSLNVRPAQNRQRAQKQQQQYGSGSHRRPAVVYHRSSPRPANRRPDSPIRLSQQTTNHQVQIQLLDGFIVPPPQGPVRHHQQGERPPGGATHIRAVPISLNDVKEIQLLLPGDVHQQLKKLHSPGSEISSNDGRSNHIRVPAERPRSPSGSPREITVHVDEGLNNIPPLKVHVRPNEHDIRPEEFNHAKKEPRPPNYDEQRASILNKGNSNNQHNTFQLQVESPQQHQGPAQEQYSQPDPINYSQQPVPQVQQISFPSLSQESYGKDQANYPQTSHFRPTGLNEGPQQHAPPQEQQQHQNQDSFIPIVQIQQDNYVQAQPIPLSQSNDYTQTRHGGQTQSRSQANHQQLNQANVYSSTDNWQHQSQQQQQQNQQPISQHPNQASLYSQIEQQHENQHYQQNQVLTNHQQNQVLTNHQQNQILTNHQQNQVFTNHQQNQVLTNHQQNQVLTNHQHVGVQATYDSRFPVTTESYPDLTTPSESQQQLPPQEQLRYFVPRDSQPPAQTSQQTIETESVFATYHNSPSPSIQQNDISYAQEQGNYGRSSITSTASTYQGSLYDSGQYGTCDCQQSCAPIQYSPADHLGSTVREIATTLKADALFDLINLPDDEISALLSANGAYTLFLPSNDAVSRLPPNLLERWRENGHSFSLTLLNHVVADSVTLSSLRLGGRMESRVGGASLFINNYNNEAVTVNGQRIMRGDVPGPQGGIIHVIDGTLCPVADQDIVDTLRSCNKYDGFLTLADVTQLMDKLQEDGPFTVFLPSNDALTKIPHEELSVLKGNITALRDFLEYHVIEGVYFSGDLKDGQYLTTVFNKQPVRVGVRVDGCYRRLVEANNSPLYKADIPAKNGVIHVVDWVLRPTDLGWCEGIILP